MGNAHPPLKEVLLFLGKYSALLRWRDRWLCSSGRYGIRRRWWRHRPVARRSRNDRRRWRRWIVFVMDAINIMCTGEIVATREEE